MTEDLNLFETAERLRTVLLNRATNGIESESEYKQLRGVLYESARTKRFVPKFLKTAYTLSDFWSFIKTKYSTYAERREFLRTEFEPLLSSLDDGAETPADLEIAAALNTRGSEVVQDAWTKALERRASDPEGAITSARTLLEAVCKHILQGRSVTFDDREDLPSLYGKVAKSLNLAPNAHSEQIFKRILGGCFSVVEGLGSLRNELGDAHAKGTTRVKPVERHAELAVNLAGSAALFLIKTWQAADDRESKLIGRPIQ